MPGRNASSGDYRYGFQGQEVDPEPKGEGNSVNYKYRVHDPRLGRFLSIDPLAKAYAHNSPYAFSENRVIDAVELEGAESKIVITEQYSNSVVNPKPKMRTVNWSDLRPGEKHGSKGSGVSFYDYNHITKKAKFTGYKTLADLGFGKHKSAKRDAGLFLEGFGDGVAVSGFIVQAVPHPVAKVVGKGLQAGGELVSVGGTALQVAADLEDKNYVDAATTLGVSFTFGAIGRKVGKLGNTGQLSGDGTTILQGIIFGNEKVVGKMRNKSNSLSSNPKPNELNVSLSSETNLSNPSLNISLEEAEQ